MAGGLLAKVFLSMQVFWNTGRTSSILISVVLLAMTFVSGRRRRSPDFPLDMCKTLCYILPVLQAYKGPKACCPRELEATFVPSGYQHANLWESTASDDANIGDFLPMTYPIPHF
jgi:hypothetical protein